MNGDTSMTVHAKTRFSDIVKSVKLKKGAQRRLSCLTGVWGQQPHKIRNKYQLNEQNTVIITGTILSCFRWSLHLKIISAGGWQILCVLKGFSGCFCWFSWGDFFCLSLPICLYFFLCWVKVGRCTFLTSLRNSRNGSSWSTITILCKVSVIQILGCSMFG